MFVGVAVVIFLATRPVGRRDSEVAAVFERETTGVNTARAVRRWVVGTTVLSIEQWAIAV